MFCDQRREHTVGRRYPGGLGISVLMFRLSTRKIDSPPYDEKYTRGKFNNVQPDSLT